MTTEPLDSKRLAAIRDRDAQDWHVCEHLDRRALLAEVDRLTAELGALVTAVHRVRAVHYKTDFGGGCGGCERQRKDCPTLAALDGAE